MSFCPKRVQIIIISFQLRKKSSFIPEQRKKPLHHGLKVGNRSTKRATFLRNEFQSDVARITTRAKNTSGLRDLVVLVLRSDWLISMIS